jgi:hypothetical protein
VSGEQGGDRAEAPLPDGNYEVFVVDVDGSRLDVTVTTGGHKGEVVTVRGSGEFGLDLLGMPGTMAVTDGVPSSVSFDL